MANGMKLYGVIDTELTPSQVVMTNADSELVTFDWLDQAVKTTSSPTFAGINLNGTVTSEIQDLNGSMYFRGKVGSGLVGVTGGDGIITTKDGGELVFYGGNGYSDPDSGTGGLGGNVTFGGGVGGQSVNGTGGVGGILQLGGGAGGDGWNGGNGGRLDIFGGRAGTGDSGLNGVAGVLNLGTSNTSVVNIGAIGITTNVLGPLSGAAITGTSFIIGANTLTTTEWAFLDGQDQAVKTTSSPQFAGLGVGAASTIAGGINTTGNITLGTDGAGNRVLTIYSATAGMNLSISTVGASAAAIFQVPAGKWIAYIAPGGFELRSGGSFYWQDSDDSNKTRMQLDTATALLAIGTQQTTNVYGQLKFVAQGANSTYRTTIIPGTNTASYTLTLPTAVAAGNNRLLLSSSTGVLSWNDAPVADNTYNTGIGPLGNMGTITTKNGIITAVTQAT